MSGKVVIISTTLGVLAAGTGISLAATQGSSSADAVTCIVVVDAKAAVDANSALSDVFPVGTPLHLTSAGREVDVTVSAPLTAAAATTAPATTAPATTAPATADPTTAAPSDPATSASASAPAGGTASKPPQKHRRHHKPTKKATAKPTTSAAATESNAEKAAQVGKVSIKAAVNKGVDPNTVCVELSKNAFNVLGNVVGGNNVGAFLATMTPTASAPPAGSGSAATSAPASGGASATTSAPAASASASTAAAGNGTTKKKHHH